MRLSLHVPRSAVAAILLVVGVVYLVLGLGYHRASKACYESRHSIDHEPMVGGGVVGVVLDAVMWPLFQASTALSEPAVSCLPRPLGS
jgi:hypothetical protein